MRGGIETEQGRAGRSKRSAAELLPGFDPSCDMAVRVDRGSIPVEALE